MPVLALPANICTNYMANRFETFGEFSHWLEGKGVFHMDLGLGRMESALGRVCPVVFPIVQVLGTNGKGSTSAFLHAIAAAGGLRCGLFISPHFLSPRERILLNGEPFSEGMWLDAARELSGVLGDALDGLTYFEFLTLLALVLFRRAGAVLAIFEAGLGGTHDATTALSVCARCYTPIALDHENVLGPGLINIARDKARAMRPGAPVFSAPQYPVVRTELAAMAAAVRVPLIFTEPLPPGVELGLSGGHQRVNAAVATECWRWLNSEFHWHSAADGEVTILSGLANAFLPGRMQIISGNGEHGTLILDGAHNCHGMQELLRRLEIKPQAIIYSALADKDWRPAQALLGRLDAPMYIVQLPGSRAEKAEILAGAFPGATVVPGHEPLREAMRTAPSPTLICGSLYLLAEFYKLFPQYLEKNN